MKHVTHRNYLWHLIDVAGDAAEIGVAEGLFSLDILNWPTIFPTFYMVDRWACNASQKGDGGNPQSWHDKNFLDAYTRTVGHRPRPKMLKGNSVEMSALVPDRSLAFLYIDADHSYEGVMADLKAWVPKLVRGGICALHDYEAPEYGVKQAVQEFCEGRFQIHLLPEDKPCDAGAYFYV